LSCPRQAQTKGTADQPSDAPYVPPKLQRVAVELQAGWGQTSHSSESSFMINFIAWGDGRTLSRREGETLGNRQDEAKTEGVPVDEVTSGSQSKSPLSKLTGTTALIRLSKRCPPNDYAAVKLARDSSSTHLTNTWLAASSLGFASGSKIRHKTSGAVKRRGRSGTAVVGLHIRGGPP